MRTAILYVTSRCNQNCIFCLEEEPAWGAFVEPSTGEICREIDELRRRGTDHLTFIGGEAFFRKDLPEILSHAKKAGLTRVGVTTNGTILSAPGFLRRMLEAGLDFIEFSLHGHNSAVANRIAGTDFTFERQARALAEINALGAPMTIVNVVTCRENKDHILDIARYLIGDFPRIPARFKLKFVSLMGRAVARSPEETLRYREVDLAGAGDFLDAHGVPFWYDNVPLCRAGRHAAHSLELLVMARDERYFDYDHGSRRYADSRYQLSGRCWPEPCADCTLRAICCGIENAYDLLHGAGELSPRSDEPLPLLAQALEAAGDDPHMAPARLEALRREPRPRTCSGIDAPEAFSGTRDLHLRLRQASRPDLTVELRVSMSGEPGPAYARVGPFTLSYVAADDTIFHQPGVRELLAAAAGALRDCDSLGAAERSIRAASEAVSWVAAPLLAAEIVRPRSVCPTLQGAARGAPGSAG